MKKKQKLIIIAILALLIFTIYMILNRKESFVKIEINGQEILLSEDKPVIDLQTLNSKNNTIIKVELKNAKVKINGEVIKDSKEVSIGKVDINKENQIEINVKLIGEFGYKSYKINTLPSGFPEYEVEGESSQEGEYYLTTYIVNNYDKHYIYNLDGKGNVTFYKETTDRAFNFKKNEVDGKIRYTYLEVTQEHYDGITSSEPCKMIVLDENYKEINEIGYLAEEGEIDTENHDYIYLGDNHYIICGYTKEEVYNIPTFEGEKARVYNCRIQEIKDEKMLWEFQSIKDENLYLYYNEDDIDIYPSKQYINYMHFNSMAIDPEDGNLICSFRNIDAIIKISRTTGEIMWILGGRGDQFGLSEEQKFSKQHSISFLSNHEILLYDNNNNNEDTRVLIIKLNEETKDVEKFESYELGVYVSRMGAVRAINENENIYLVTYGLTKLEYAFEELNLETMEPIFKFKILGENSKLCNSLYCVNMY